MKIKIISGDIEVNAELNKSNTAKKIAKILPIEASANRWGDEIYFEIPLKIEEESSTEIVDVGDLAYWLDGSCFCIFFGRTPASTDKRPRASSAVNVFGKILGNATVLKKIKSGDKIKVEVIK